MRASVNISLHLQQQTQLILLNNHFNHFINKLLYYSETTNLQYENVQVRHTADWRIIIFE